MDTGWMDRKATQDNLRPLVKAGVLSPGELEQALRIAGIIPDGKAWGRFLNTLFLMLGSIFLAAGVIFFFAYNWDSMHRLLKLAVVQTALIITIVVSSYHGFEKLPGKASLLVSCILVGALFALFGQIYQTGADAYELFLAWSAFITGWVIISNFAVLWLLLLILLEAALFLYWAQVVEMSWFIYRSPVIYELIFGINVLALTLWELFSSRGVAWLRGRWIPRLVASIGLFFLMIPLVILIVDRHALSPGSKYNMLLPLLYIASVGFVLWFYRSLIFDLYMIALTLLSVIVLISIFFARHIGSNYGGFLLLSLLIVGLSAGTAAWLRSLARKQSSEIL